MKLLSKWNESHKGIPSDKSVAAYAIEKEKEFPRESVVLDLGGGIGVDAVYFAEQGHEVTLADISDYALSVAQDLSSKKSLVVTTKHLTLEHGDINLEDNIFDIIYSRLALHYFDVATTTSLFGEVNRILKPGGTAFITIKSPNDEKEIAFLKETAEEVEENVFLDGGNTVSRYSEKQLNTMLAEAGVSEYSIEEYIESLEGRVDKVKSGAKVFLLNEITITKPK